MLSMNTQATGYCKTWAGEGGADAGTVRASTDLEFYIDLEPATGQETVVVAEVKPVRRQVRAPIIQPSSDDMKRLLLHTCSLQGLQRGLLLNLGKQLAGFATVQRCGGLPCVFIPEVLHLRAHPAMPYHERILHSRGFCLCRTL